MITKKEPNSYTGLPDKYMEISKLLSFEDSKKNLENDLIL